MRNYVTRIGCIMIGMTLALLAAPTAQADDATFVARARALGMQQTPDYLINSGRSVCVMLSMGQTPDQLADRIVGHSGLGAREARQFIGLSTREYCP